MKEKILQHIKTPLGMSVLGLTIILTLVTVYASGNTTTQIEQTAPSTSESIEIATVDTSATSSGGVENSWPGEILSLGNLPVQPEREGTIAGWQVHIGESVRAGQVLGTLSRPPATPELVGMLAGEAEGLAKARSNADAEEIYVTERTGQLLAQRASIEQSSVKTGNLLDSTQTTSSGSVVAVKKKNVRSILENTIATTYPYLSGNATIPTTYQSITLRSSIGAQNSQLRDAFPDILYSTLSDIRNENVVPERSGLAYFDHTIKLVNASLPDGSMLTSSDLATLKGALSAGRSDFIEALGALRESELESVSTGKDYSTDIKEIDAQIAELRKTLSIAKGEVVAKEAAYKTVSNAVNGGNAIISPRSGVVSTILKKPGEFVAPGMPVAIITSEAKNEKSVRFAIPVTAQKPAINSLLRIVRPGFPADIQTAKLIGVGSSVDGMGTYMADAIFSEANEWTVGGSVRVLLGGDSKTVAIPLSSLMWDENGTPYVWGVSSADRLYAKKLKLGRTLGTSVEVYEGLVGGDRYVVSPTSLMHEDALLSELAPKQDTHTSDSSESMDGMNMEGMDMHEHE
jgi:multidrug efflux pump subunit AcrA (membrane-fusion protein)